MEINKTITLNCTKEVLWTWLTEFEKLKQWNDTILEEKQISTGATSKGHLSQVLIKEGNQKNWYQNEILEYQPPHLLKIALSGGNLGKNPMFVSYNISETTSQVKLNYNSQWKPSGIILRLLYPLIKMQATKNTEKVLTTLKTQIEK